ncbi:hypothetical protein GEMRC1_004709 [Eukaryota sp. GEM-RC1]
MPSRAPKTPPPSELIDPKYSRSYTVGKLLGTGGFAHVYELTDTVTGLKYAGKVFDKSAMKKDRAREKLRSEINIQRGLHHPNIVSLYSHFEYRDKIYFIMELCPNTSVHALLQKRKYLNEYEARFIFKGILNGVAYLHSRNIIHRDLKLHNFFFSSSFDVKIGDFGLSAELMSIEDHRKTMCGTPNYMAPEIVSRSVDGHSFHVDIWSLGVILFTMLFGRPPFETRDLKLTYKRITSVDYTYPENPKVSAEAKTLISRLLQADPQLRPSITELELDPWLQEWQPLSFSPDVFSTPIEPDTKSALRRVQSPDITSHPSVPYVLCWMDYSDRYGLGYILSDGTVGAVFNDETKAFITPELKDRGEFVFINRKLAVPDQMYDGPPEIYSLRYCSDALKKKSKLLMIFDKNLNAHLETKEGRQVCHLRPTSLNQIIYMKKFHSSNRATAFRLSNRTLQANFADHSKIVVSVNDHSLSFWMTVGGVMISL